MHKSLNENEIQPDANSGFHGNRKGLLWGKRRHHVFSHFFDWIHFILAGNNDIHKSLNEFEIWRDPTMAALERLKKIP